MLRKLCVVGAVGCVVATGAFAQSEDHRFVVWNDGAVYAKLVSAASDVEALIDGNWVAAEAIADESVSPMANRLFSLAVDAVDDQVLTVRWKVGDRFDTADVVIENGVVRMSVLLMALRRRH